MSVVVFVYPWGNTTVLSWLLKLCNKSGIIQYKFSVLFLFISKIVFTLLGPWYFHINFRISLWISIVCICSAFLDSWSVCHPFITGPVLLTVFFIFCILDGLAFGGLTDLGRNCPSQGLLIPKGNHILPR